MDTEMQGTNARPSACVLGRKRQDRTQSQHWLLAQPHSYSSMTLLRIDQFGIRATKSTKNGV